MIPRIERVGASALLAGEWDVSAIAAKAAERARQEGRSQVALWLTADNCPGCLMLKAQIVGDAADRLYAQADVVLLELGDVQADLVRTLRLGECTLTTPGVPTIYMLRLLQEPAQLALASLSLGPLSPVDAHGDIKKLVEGTSRWVAEATGAVIELCQAGFCTPLNEANRFHADATFHLT